MVGIIKSDDVWDDVLSALKLCEDVDKPMTKMVVTLEAGKPVVVEQVTHIKKDRGA